MFLINLQGKDSIYEQIKNQIAKFIATGVLKPGDKLPAVRGLAEDLGINPNTVMKAYQELEKNGYIYMLNKKGAFVHENSVEKQEDRENEIHLLLTRFKDEGIKKEEILGILNEVYEGGSNA